jgi:hypothetical protein
MLLERQTYFFLDALGIKVIILLMLEPCCLEHQIYYSNLLLFFLMLVSSSIKLIILSMLEPLIIIIDHDADGSSIKLIVVVLNTYCSFDAQALNYYY